MVVWWPVPKGQCQCSLGTPHVPALGLGQQFLSVPRATAVVAQVHRVVPKASQVVLHTSHSRCQGASPTAPCPHTNLFPGHQANRAGGRDSTGPGAIPASTSSQSQHLQRGNSGCWTFSPEDLVGLRQGHGMGQDPVPHPHLAAQDPVVLLAEGTAGGEPRGLCGVPGMLE